MQWEVEIQKRVLKSGAVRWRVRWRQGDRYRSQTFDRKGDAVTFAAEIRRRQQLGTLATLDSGRISLADYVINTWGPAYWSNQQLLNKHVLPELGPADRAAPKLSDGLKRDSCRPPCVWDESSLRTRRTS